MFWYRLDLYCDHLGCEYKAKQASSLKKHKAYTHGIDLVWV